MSVTQQVVLHVSAGYELGTGRLVPTSAAGVGLVSVIVGWLARKRATRTAAIVTLAAGLVSVVVGGVHGANAAGGPGTGNGLVGAVFAVVLGLAGLALGWLALARSRRGQVTG